MEIENLVVQTGIMLGTLIGVIIAVVNIKKLNKQQQLIFFADYTKRFQDIMLNLPIGIYENNISLSGLEPEERTKTIRYMRAYFDLCSEEYDLYLNKNLEARIWKEWKSGIEFFFSKRLFQECWDIINSDNGYYPDFSQLVDDILQKVKAKTPSESLISDVDK
ncbi:hypothetical protein [Pontibacter sp. G13]|uniref:hypothetical protein n=1 Tax=Pontibacter sp. G13 TaxID=3074898 RepID=UPI00288BB8DB|nr:hypothetical protein [Pontibacter sp. G13]WNJ17574.1 hypothetical protein RJD25_22215 [Pontibacter sp. G13]